ncbi:MAG: hypothetical protein ABUL62_00305 [Myxococcales bacterium]|jgi:hypothetical protein
MNKTQWLLLSALCALCVLAACSGRRLPPGTPPPEYEAPIVTPWAPDSGDAGPPQAADRRAEPINPLDSGPGPELSLDAGPR